MSKFIRHKRKDRNHAAIVKRFEGGGATVDDVSDLADLGYDVIVGYLGYVVFVEIKDGEKPPSARKLTESEEAASHRWGNLFAVVNNETEADGLLDSIREHRSLSGGRV